MDVGNSKTNLVAHPAAPPSVDLVSPDRLQIENQEVCRAEHYALHGVINGFLPSSRASRGRAWIHCSGPNMWAYAAPALGFTVRGMDVKCSAFLKLLGHMDQAPEKDVLRRECALGWNRLQGLLGEVQVVFTDHDL